MEELKPVADQAAPLTRAQLRARQALQTHQTNPPVLTRAMLREQAAQEQRVEQASQEPRLEKATQEQRLEQPLPAVSPQEPDVPHEALAPTPVLSSPSAQHQPVAPAPVMTRAMLRELQEQESSPVSTFDQIPSLDVDLTDPLDAMCEQHAHEANSYSHRGPVTASTANQPTRSARRSAVPKSRDTPRKSRATGAAKNTSRVAVLVSLALATLATPAALAQTPDTQPQADPDLQPEMLVALVGPSTADVVLAQPDLGGIPTGLAQPVSLDERVVQVASRTDQRTPLSGCDGTVIAAGENGLLDERDLCQVTPGHTIRADAAIAFLALSEAYQERFGERICLVSSYRNLRDQHIVKRNKGSLAATPGKSNHGWGLAIDICNNSYSANSKWTWLNENGPRFGWAQPSWASRSYEPWHWEFTAGVEAR